MSKKMIKLLLFVVILLLCAYRVNEVFKFKDINGVYIMKTFYELPKDSVDVLCVGSSTVFVNINPALLYEKYGIAAYNLCGAAQPAWNAYYDIKEALKTQKPKLIVYDAMQLRVSYNDGYQTGSFAIINTYGLKWSANKLDAIKASVPANKFYDYLIGPLQYHGRYKELDRKDFLSYRANPANYKYWKGYYALVDRKIDAKDLVRRDISKIKTPVKLDAKVEEYYRKIIDLADSEKIPLIVVIPPYAFIGSDQQRYFLEAERIAAEYDVPFINFNLLYDELGLDFKTDMADKTHLTLSGSSKYTEYLGKYISDNYGLPDRRGDAKYESWEKNSEYFNEELRMLALMRYKSFKAYMVNIPFDNCVSIITASDAAVWNNLDAESFHRIDPGENMFNPKVIVRHGGDIVYSSCEPGPLVWHKQISGADFAVKSSNGVRYTISVNGKEYQTVANGVNAVVYNTYTNQVSDAAGFDAEKEYALKRSFKRHTLLQ